MSVFVILSYTALVVANFGVSIFARTFLAGDAKVAVHWMLDGTPDSFAPANFGLFIIPIASVVAMLILLSTGNAEKLFLSACGVLFVLLVGNLVICWSNLGYGINVVRWVFLSMLVLVALIVANVLQLQS